MCMILSSFLSFRPTVRLHPRAVLTVGGFRISDVSSVSRKCYTLEITGDDWCSRRGEKMVRTILATSIVILIRVTDHTVFGRVRGLFAASEIPTSVVTVFI